MAKVRITVDGPLMDGHKITFKAPCSCSNVEKLKVCHVEEGEQKTTLFTMKDSHGNDVTGLGNLFSEGAYVNVVLDTVNSFAYLLNADTNSYLENRLGNIKLDVVDSLDSTAKDKALSANKGKELADKIKQTRYTDKITLSSSKFQIISQELIHKADGFVYIRLSGETLEDLNAGDGIIIGYVNSSFVDNYSHPATAVVGLTSYSSDTVDMRALLYGTSSEDGYERQIRGKATAKINKGAHIYVTLYYYLNK